MKNLIIILLTTVILLFSCKKDEEKAIAYPINIPFTTISKGNRLCTKIGTSIPSSKFVIGSQTDWGNFLIPLDTFCASTKSLINSAIDFQKNQLIVVIDTIRWTNGWTVDVIDIKEQQNTIDVTTDNLLKNGNGTVVTQPYHIVQIPKQTKPIVFK